MSITRLWSNQNGKDMLATDAADDSEEFVLSWLHNVGSFGLSRATLSSIVTRDTVADVLVVRGLAREAATKDGLAVLVITEAGEAELSRIMGEA